MNTLKAEKRTMDIKAKRLRREGFVTGNVFGRQIETSIPIKMDKQAVERLLKTCGKGSQHQLIGKPTHFKNRNFNISHACGMKQL